MQQMQVRSTSNTNSALMLPRRVKVELVDDQEAEEQSEKDPRIDMDKLRILLQRKPEMGKFLQVGQSQPYHFDIIILDFISQSAHVGQNFNF